MLGTKSGSILALCTIVKNLQCIMPKWNFDLFQLHNVNCKCKINRNFTFFFIKDLNKLVTIYQKQNFEEKSFDFFLT